MQLNSRRATATLTVSALFLVAAIRVYAADPVPVPQLPDWAVSVVAESERTVILPPAADNEPLIILAYNNAGELVRAAAQRTIRTYQKVTAVVIVKRTEGKLVVDAVLFPDLERIRDDAKRANVERAAAAFSGHVIAAGADASPEFQKVNAISGATRYHNAVYEELNQLAVMLAGIMSEAGQPQN
jgi:hypothetical protein